MLWVFFLGVAANEGGTSPFLINGFKRHKSEDTEAATAEVETDPPSKLG